MTVHRSLPTLQSVRSKSIELQRRALAVVFVAVSTIAVIPLVSASEPEKPRIFVLLRNHHVLSGGVEKIGDQVSISSADGSKLRLSMSEIAAFGASLDELYLHRKKHRIDGDLRGLQNEIRWSLRNGLIRQAAQDTLLARSLDPADPTTQQLLRQVAAKMRASSKTQNTPQRLPSIQTVSHEVTITEPSPDRGDQAVSHENELEWIPDRTRILFATRVQPTLMNRCSKCHGHARTVTDTGPKPSFRIHSAITRRMAQSRVDRENLRSVLTEVDLETPSNSRLRRYALDGHGGRGTSFGPEHSSMTKNLDRWLAEIGEAYQTKLRTDRILSPSAEDISGSDRQGEDPRSERSTETITRVRRMPEIENPFDPAIFNRRYHGLSTTPARDVDPPSESTATTPSSAGSHHPR